MAGAKPSGRRNQKSRTRKDLLQAAARLVKQGRRPGLEEVVGRLENGDPSIRVGTVGLNRTIAVVPVDLQDGEEEIVARRLKEILTG